MTVGDRPSVCFVTNELYPLGPGGIGRMLYNFAKYNAEQGLPADFHFLVPKLLLDSRPDAADLLAEAFDGIATIHVCPSLASVPTPIGNLLARSLDHPWTSEWLFAQSYGYYLGLLDAEKRVGAPFTVIEFPDFGGWAQASIEAKRAGLHFTDTLISARIHSTQGMLYGVERYVNDPGHWAGIMFDAERHLLAHADLIVGHDPEVTTRTATFYGLSERWNGRTRLEFPPVYLNVGEGRYARADTVVPPRVDRECRDFLFGSRLQPVKRPDLFIRAAILFLERHPDHDGRFRLVCNGWDRAYVDGLKALVPDAMQEQILFLEKATPAERLAYIDSAIVVVPSDYESLCLFAFEAALAGRKVILNAVCPAFGNDVRWHDGQNCLLFDGSVESLTDAMERAIDWQPAQNVDAVPDAPYWLGDLPAPLAASTAPATATTIYCYGAQSPPEFRRHYDAICRLTRELDAAAEPYQVVFQLPRDGFDPAGPEYALIRQHGWQLQHGSGVRECPQMFGKRLARLPTPTVLLCPFGYDPVPGFATTAIRVKRAHPALALVSGQIEVVDSGSGRSDCIRVYSGEAPSTALLSGRIAPPLCLLDIRVLDRIMFDPWAGQAWFEVFARSCALRGEAMVIVPELAAALDGLLRHRAETSKRISASLLDQMGIASGWQARLLSIDPVQVPSDADNRPVVYGVDQMRRVVRINPAGRTRSWEPVGWQDYAQGVLVHPLNGETTIAELPGPYRRVSKVSVQVRNLRRDNAGAEVAIALARSNVEVHDILHALKQGGDGDQIALSPWSRLEPGGHCHVVIACYGISRGRDKILLMSRPVPGGSDEHAEIVFSELETSFDNLSIG